MLLRGVTGRQAFVHIPKHPSSAAERRPSWAGPGSPAPSQAELYAHARKAQGQGGLGGMDAMVAEAARIREAEMRALASAAAVTPATAAAATSATSTGATSSTAAGATPAASRSGPGAAAAAGAGAGGLAEGAQGAGQKVGWWGWLWGRRKAAAPAAGEGSATSGSGSAGAGATGAGSKGQEAQGGQQEWSDEEEADYQQWLAANGSSPEGLVLVGGGRG